MWDFENEPLSLLPKTWTNRRKLLGTGVREVKGGREGEGGGGEGGREGGEGREGRGGRGEGRGEGREGGREGEGGEGESGDKSLQILTRYQKEPDCCF